MYQEYSAQSGKVSVGDLLVTGVGTIGVPWLVTSENPIYFKDGNIIWFKNAGEIDGEFFFHSFIAGAIQSYINEAAGIGTVGTYTIDTGKKTPIWLPAKQEQRCVAALMTRLDSLITLHQCKCQHCSLCGYLSWEQRKLGDFGHVAMNKRIYKEQTAEQGDVPFFKIGTFGGTPDAFISSELFEEYKELYPYPKPGTLLLSAAGSIGRTVEYAGEMAYFQDSNIVWLEHNELLLDSFLRIYYERQTWGSLEGSTIKRLYNKDILDANICLPDTPEQSAIGHLFKSLDSLITLHQ